MRSVKFLLSTFVIGLAASGSIWLGWIYADTHHRQAKVDSPRNSSKGADSTAVPAPIPVSEALSAGATQSSKLIPDLSKIEILPGASLSSSTDQLNGFPTVTRDVLRRAAGQGTASDLLEIEIPLPGQKSGSVRTEGLGLGQSSGGTRP